MSTKWLKAAGVRALKNGMPDGGCHYRHLNGFSDVNWVIGGSASLRAGIISILTSLAGLPEVD